MATGEFPISVVLRAVDEVTKPLKKINRRIDKLVSPIRRTNNAFRLLSREAGLGRLANSVRGVGRATGRVAGEVGGLVKKFALLGTVAAGGLFAAVRSQARLGDSVSKTATKLGIGIEALQEYRFAAERSGVNIATFDMAMQRFGRRVGEAANGMGEARTALKTLGISVRDTTGSVRSLESLLPEIADKLSKVESENVRNALAMKFFDSEGVALVNMLEDGSEGMEKLRSEARKLGLVMSETTIKDSVKFTDAMTDISSALLGVRNVVGGELLPVFTDIIKEITEFAVGNQDKIRAFSKNFAVKIPNALRKTRDVLGELSQMAKPVIDIVTRITDRFGVANTIGAVLAVTIGGKLLLAVVALTQAFGVLGLSTIKPLLSLFLIFKHITGAVLVKSLFQLGLSLSLIVPKIIAVGSAFMATPMGAILGIIALLAGGAFLIIKKWEPIKEFFKSLWDGIKKGFLSMLRFFKFKIPSLTSLIPDTISDFFKSSEKTTQPLKVIQRLGASHPIQQLNTEHPNHDESPFRLNRNSNLRERENLKSLNAERLGRNIVQTQTVKTESAIRIKFDNLPVGARVEKEREETPIDLDTGPVMVGP